MPRTALTVAQIIVAAFFTIAGGTLPAQNLSAPAGRGASAGSAITGAAAAPIGGGQDPSTENPQAASHVALHPYFKHFVSAGAIRYGVAGSEGVFVSVDGGKTWEIHDTGLPHRMVYPFNDRGIETITAIGVDPLNPERVAVTTSIGLWVSEDAGRTWSEIPLRPPVKSVAYITSVAVSPWSRTTYSVGTSFSGVFETTDNGRSWTSYSDSLKFLYRGAGFYEEISGLSYSPVQRDVLYLGVGFGGGIYRSNSDKSSWTSLDFPVGTTSDSPATVKGRVEIIRQLSSRLSQGQPELSVATRSQYWKYSPVKGEWKRDGTPPVPPQVDPAKRKRIAEAADRSGLYLAAINASGERLDKMIKLAKENGLNAFVVDVKDDFGRLTYDSHVPLARKIGAVHPFFNLRELIQKAHENGIYVIGRMVVFKDEELFSYDNYKYAVWNRVTDKPWRNMVKEVDGKTGAVTYVQKEYWVDPFSERVWRYNVAIAEELQSMGIDEVQFDYIRFPSDGPLKDALYRFKRPGMSRIDALESYMVMARRALHLPISTDLYGFNCWYRMGNWIGQNIEMLSKYVDVVCPMYYPSLFPRKFMEHVPYLQRAKDIYLDGTRRAQEIVQGRADIRPFVQAFLLQPNEVAMDKPEYSKYLRIQLEGAKEARSSGFTLWNASNIYYMMTFPLTPYVASRDANR